MVTAQAAHSISFGPFGLAYYSNAMWVGKIKFDNGFCHKYIFKLWRILSILEFEDILKSPK